MFFSNGRRVSPSPARMEKTAIFASVLKNEKMAHLTSEQRYTISVMLKQKYSKKRVSKSGRRISAVSLDSCWAKKKKNAKEKRMATVEEKTLEVAAMLKEKYRGWSVFELVESTYFSPVVPRMVKALRIIFGS